MYEVEFFTPDRLSEFWEIVVNLLKFAAPAVIIFIAISMVGIFLVLIIRAFKEGSEEKSEKEYDIKHYD